MKVFEVSFRAIFENMQLLMYNVMINYSFGNSAPAFTDIIVRTIVFWTSYQVNNIMFVFKLCLVLNLKLYTELFACKANICFNCAR